MRSVLRRAGQASALAILALSCTTGPALAAPGDDRVLPIDQYKSEKARRLGTTHDGALRELASGVYHCLPWLEVQKQSVGFFKPKHLTQDDRYVSIRFYVEQDPSPEFAAFTMEQRAASMFSRYVGPMLKRMSRNSTMVNDSSMDGFTVIVEWLKPSSDRASGRPIHETIAVFVDKATATAFLRGSIQTRDLSARAHVLGFDGETGLGQLKLAAWDDTFMSTYKVQNYEVAPGVNCQ
jgi:hypothetical protein